MNKIDLQGIWHCQLDANKEGMRLPFTDTCPLPGTTSYWQKGTANVREETYFLTDAYKFEGYAWFQRKVEIPEAFEGQHSYIYLERTRKTRLWLDGHFIGEQDSLNGPHIYLTSDLAEPGEHEILICVDNTDYKTKGGHLTSEDTQSNWNGVTGDMAWYFVKENRVANCRVKSDVETKAFIIEGELLGVASGQLDITVKGSLAGTTVEERLLADSHLTNEANYQDLVESFEIQGPRFEIRLELGPQARLWSEFEPFLYELTIQLRGGSGENLLVGLRDFRADGDKFSINGFRTFLRGKHDGLIFPLTGYAPTDVATWLEVMGRAKDYGINHYRFHTCCPPEAAFEAADRLGIYMEPELPFWGTIHAKDSPEFDALEHEYLIEEGFRILKTFGNHPSFVMMSLGNELWGDKATINAMIKRLKTFDNRPLFTQGSNNFQWVPSVLSEEDFFCGVRFGDGRLIRGSYAMCDAPQGHVQTKRPSTMTDYDRVFIGSHPNMQPDSEIEIQYGTGIKKVKAQGQDKPFVPQVPVISHEIGQYETYPNYNEIKKYTGPLKARNLEVFQRRLAEAGMLHLAEDFFHNSGTLAMACYKEEVEAALRTTKLAGFQLLDLQDFSGQGTALVGVLDAFMAPKGIIDEKVWRGFCSDLVPLARFEDYNLLSGQVFLATVQVAIYRPLPIGFLPVSWSLRMADEVHTGTFTLAIKGDSGLKDVGRISIGLPDVSVMTQVDLTLEIEGYDLKNHYELYLHPQVDPESIDFEVTKDLEAKLLEASTEPLLVCLNDPKGERSLEGTYASDFWCYPMFKSISESMQKKVPIGTLGLNIKKDHDALRVLNPHSHSTPAWYGVVEKARPFILDHLPIEPIVQVIDNVARNHRLGILFEAMVGKRPVLFITATPNDLMASLEGRTLLQSLSDYLKSGHMNPTAKLTIEEVMTLI